MLPQQTEINSPITLNGSAETLDAHATTRHVLVSSAGMLQIFDMILNSGDAGVSNDGSSDGGAIWVEAGAQLTATSVTFSNNSAFSGGAIDVNAGATVNVSTSTFRANTALRAGGAI